MSASRGAPEASACFVVDVAPLFPQGESLTGLSAGMTARRGDDCAHFAHEILPVALAEAGRLAEEWMGKRARGNRPEAFTITVQVPESQRGKPPRARRRKT